MAEEVLPPAKRRRVVKEEEGGSEREEGKAHLLSLSDDVLLGVLGYLSSWDLLQVSPSSYSPLSPIASYHSGPAVI